MMTGIDLFKEYIMDRENRFLHYDDEMRGFITYSFPPNGPGECFIDDMFVLDSERRLSVVMTMIRFVESEAIKFGKKYLTAAVSVKKPDADRILRAHLWHGLKPFATNSEFIFTKKEL